MQKFLIRSLFLVLLLSAAESWALPPWHETHFFTWVNGIVSHIVDNRGEVLT